MLSKIANQGVSHSYFSISIQNIVVKIAIIIAMICFIPAAAIAEEQEQLSYIGSSTVAKYINAAAKVYPNAAFTINTLLESSGGEKWLAHGRGDIGGVAREVKQKYLDMGVVATLIGRDGIGVLVNIDNPIIGLTSARLQDIFTGRIKNWQELGGDDLAISIYLPANNSASYAVFKRIILADKEYIEHETIIPDERIISQISTYKGSIGILSLSFLRDRESLRILAVDGQKASLNNSHYPITRPLYLTTKGTPTGAAKKFIDWTLSPSGQKIIKKNFIGVSTPAKTEQEYNEPMPEMPQ